MLRRSRLALAFPILLLVVLALSSLRAEAGDTKSPHKGAKDFVVWPAADLKWEALPDAPPGAMLARISGDSTKGAYTGIQKFSAGFSVPMHTHPANHKVVVISGTWIHGEPGKPDAKLGPGSYLFQPAGMKHTTACDAASECVFYIESSGKFGIKMAEEKPAK
jgi:quercetin dioxygenase-like cupin family protein